MAAITVTSATELSNTQGHLLIVSDIQLEDDLILASGTSLEFRDGAQIICVEEVYDQNNNAIVNHFSVAFNNNTIIASDYSVFIGYANISGSLANAEINADWFGAATAGLCTKAVNAAIGLSLNQTVVMPSRVYTINSNDISPIVLDKNGTSLVCHGQIECSTASRSCVFDIRGERMNIFIRRIGTIDNNNLCSALRISGNACDSDIQIDYATGFYRGLEFTPKFEGGETYIGIRNCRLEWQLMNCGCDIYIDLFAGLDSIGETEIEQWPLSVEFAGNHFKGGRLQGEKGIYFEPQPSMSKVKYLVYTPTENIFENIGFERHGQRSITLDGCDNFIFKNCRLSAGELNELNGHGHSRVLSLDHCRNIRIDNKSDIKTDRLCTCATTNVALRNISSTFGEVMNISLLKGNSFYSGEVPISSHFNKMAINRISEYTSNEVTQISFADLFPKTTTSNASISTDITSIVTKIVKITVRENETLNITCNKYYITALPEILLWCILSSGSYLNFIGEENEIIRSINSSTMILTGELFEL